MLTQMAHFFLENHCGNDKSWTPDLHHPRMKSLKAFFDDENEKASPWSSHRRDNTIRAMVRFLVVVDPIILGNSIERTRARFDAFFNQTDVELKWDKSLSRYLRRTSEEHNSYTIKMATKTAEKRNADFIKALKIEEKSMKALERKAKLDEKLKSKLTSLDSTSSSSSSSPSSSSLQVEFAKAEMKMNELLGKLVSKAIQNDKTPLSPLG
jgi:hypothetical protein